MSATVPLRRVAQVVNGGTPTPDVENWNGDVAWATPVDLARFNGGALSVTDRTLTPLGLAKGSRSVPDGSVLLSTRAPIGYVTITGTRMAFNQGCKGLVFRPGQEARFHAYQLWAMRDQLNALGTGSTFLELSTDNLMSVPIAAPNTETQNRIADFLDHQGARIDEAAKLRREQINALREVEHAKLSAEFDDLGERYGWIPLRRWVRDIEQGWSPQCETRPAGHDESGVLKLGAVRAGRFRPEENKVLPPDLPPAARFRVNPGDLLVSRANTPLLVGEAAVVPKGVPENLYLCDLLYRVFLGVDAADFVCAALRTRRARGVIGVVARGTSQSMVKLRGEDIYDISIPNAPAQARARATEVVHRTAATTDAAISEMTSQIALLEERKRSLITAAVTGEFDVATATGRGI